MQLFHNGIDKKEIEKRLGLGIVTIYRIFKKNS